MAIGSTYCTQRDLEDIYPNINDYDSKEAIYGFVRETHDSIIYYVAYNVGLVTNLFIDGKNQQDGKQTLGSIVLTTTNETFSSSDTTLTCANDGNILDSTFIKIDDEILGVTAKGGGGGDDITVTRGQLGTTAASHTNGTNIYQHFNPSADGQWLNDTTNDFLAIRYASSPNDFLVEGGEEYSTLLTRIMKNASRYFDSRVDARLPRDQFKDKEGNFNYLVIRTTALVACWFMIKSHDPGSPVGKAFEEELNYNFELINSGKSQLSNAVTSDSSQGIVREVVSPQDANPLHIVDTRGHYRGTYDLLKVEIEATGAYGVATFKVHHFSNDKIFGDVTDPEIITGGLQHL